MSSASSTLMRTMIGGQESRRWSSLNGIAVLVSLEFDFGVKRKRISGPARGRPKY
jgi:hypothetical protein